MLNFNDWNLDHKEGYPRYIKTDQVQNIYVLSDAVILRRTVIDFEISNHYIISDMYCDFEKRSIKQFSLPDYSRIHINSTDLIEVINSIDNFLIKMEKYIAFI